MTFLTLLNPLESISWKPGSTIPPFEWSRFPPQFSGFIVIPHRDILSPRPHRSFGSKPISQLAQHGIIRFQSGFHSCHSGALWWPLLGSRHTVWIVSELHGNPVGWRTSIQEQLCVTYNIAWCWLIFNFHVMIQVTPARLAITIP